MFDKRHVRTRGGKSTRHIPCAIRSPSVTRPPAERGDVLGNINQRMVETGCTTDCSIISQLP